MCFSAAVVAGEVEAVMDSNETDVAGEGIDPGTCVARNMWYVWMQARMNRQLSGMIGRPSLFVRFWSAKA